MTDCGSRNRVLVADDERMIRNLNTMFLKRSFPELEVEEFSNGVDLEYRLNQDVGNVRLVITDNDMISGLKGGEIIKKYSTRPEFSKIPFILYYGGHPDLGREALDNGAFTYMLKPNPMFRAIIKGALEYSNGVTGSSQ